MDTFLHLIKKHQVLRLVSKNCKIIFRDRGNEFILEYDDVGWMGEWRENIDSIELLYKYKFCENKCQNISDAKQSKLVYVPGPHKIENDLCANHSWIFDRNAFPVDDFVYYMVDPK